MQLDLQLLLLKDLIDSFSINGKFLTSKKSVFLVHHQLKQLIRVCINLKLQNKFTTIFLVVEDFYIKKLFEKILFKLSLSSFVVALSVSEFNKHQIRPPLVLCFLKNTKSLKGELFNTIYFNICSIDNKQTSVLNEYTVFFSANNIKSVVFFCLFLNQILKVECVKN